MSLKPENLDDRNFEQLLEEAKRVVRERCPGWTDLSASDPGIALLEAFAYLTDVLIYRLNRLPEKAYVEFLRLMGVQRRPPSAARVTLRFSRTGERAGARPRVEIPRGTRVTTAGRGEGEAPVFTTAQSVALEPDRNDVEVLAFHCDQIEAELAGVGTGVYGQSFLLRRPPLVAPTGDRGALVVGEEATPAEIATGHSRKSGDKTFRIWTELGNFAEVETEAERYVYTVDRMDGRITFAPSVQGHADGDAADRPVGLAEAPGDGREIRVWYRRGGGSAGNVSTHTLTVMKDVIPGLNVTNPAPATGGRDAEPLANTLRRGPQELHSLRRAVTARDFERIATGVGGVARARALTMAQVWTHAEAGTVEVLLVPDVAERARADGLRLESLLAHQTEDLIRHIRDLLDERRPLGTQVRLAWARYQPVSVKARIVAFRGEDLAELARRVRSRLEAFISPLPTPHQPTGWPFGQPLQVGRVYDAILKEPGVKDVDRLRMVVDDVPAGPVQSSAGDQFQPRTWFVVSGDALFRSGDDGVGWQRLTALPDMESSEAVRFVRTHPVRAGWVAAVTRRPGAEASARVLVSDDCGESWRVAAATAFDVNDVAWILRAGVPSLFIASARGLFELAMRPAADLEQLLVGDLPPDLGFWGVEVINDVRGQPVNVAVAAERNRGVFISQAGGRSKTYEATGLADDVRVLAVQYDGSRSFFWAGLSVAGNVSGKGCYRWDGPNDGWRQFLTGWRGGSCYGLAVAGLKVLAATYDGGVLVFDSGKRDPAWQSPAPDCGLPRRDDTHPFHPIADVAVDPAGRVILAAARSGVFRSLDQGRTYAPMSRTEFTDRISLSSSSLFCSADHEITVVGEDDADATA